MQEFDKTVPEHCYVIAEAGVNHNGCEKLAFDMVDVAVSAGADAIKFQTFTAEKLVTAAAKKAKYQVDQVGEGNQLEMLKSLELTEESHRKLSDYCKSRDIDFLSTPFDESAADFLIGLGCNKIKIPSGEITNIPFIRYLAAKNIPLILSTGMSDLSEVSTAVNEIKLVRQALGFNSPLSEALSLLHCTSNYPTPLCDVNLLAMQTLASTFGLPVGYSDHTAGTFVAPLACAMGASIIEKHFTLDRTMDGPDHAASLEPCELHSMIQDIRNYQLIKGSGIKAPVESELDTRIAARRSVVLVNDISADTKLTISDLTLMRPGNGIAPADLDKLIGLTLTRDMVAGSTLEWDDIRKK
ncbi:N-acetylneuraminate synthase [Aliamphritea hakodatensis]|uniref:N-acetylneuraminate synthase n=1 Tax=Aliamphritea hakodatensis TaxID=2895352 RepID=UPI0022FD3841|nr:N-acetylneuraminate synthase [Aliamphritea hakodatensis]